MSTQSSVPRYAVVGATVIVCAVLAACTAIAITGHGLGDMLAIVGVVAVPAVGALLAALNERSKATNSQVNGRFTELLVHNREMAQRLGEIAAYKRHEELRRQFAGDGPERADWRGLDPGGGR